MLLLLLYPVGISFGSNNIFTVSACFDPFRFLFLSYCPAFAGEGKRAKAGVFLSGLAGLDLFLPSLHITSSVASHVSVFLSL
jgi:hypothetical protein